MTWRPSRSDAPDLSRTIRTCDVAESRLRKSRPLTETGTGSTPRPYNTAGMRPRRRSSVRALLGRTGRFSQFSSPVSMNIAHRAPASAKERAYRLLIMNASHGFRYKRGHRQNLQFLQLRLHLGAQQDAVGDNDFLDVRFVQPL